MTQHEKVMIFRYLRGVTTDLLDVKIEIVLFNGKHWSFISGIQVIVHEWAKLRWGVFEEHGYPGEAK